MTTETYEVSGIADNTNTPWLAGQGANARIISCATSYGGKKVSYFSGVRRWCQHVCDDAQESHSCTVTYKSDGDQKDWHQSAQDMAVSDVNACRIGV